MRKSNILHKTSYLLTAMFLLCFPSVGYTQQSVADFQMKCEAPMRAKGNPFTDNMFGIVTADGVSIFFQYYSRNHKQVAFKVLQGSFKKGQLVIKGKGFWINRNKSYPYFFSVKAENMYEALKKELVGYESTGDWKRKCTLKLVGEPLKVASISNTNKRINGLRNRLDAALSESKDFKKRLEINEGQLSSAIGKLSETQKNLDEARSLLQQEKSVHDSEMSKIRNKKNVDEEKINSLSAKLNDVSVELKEAKDKLQTKNKELKDQLAQSKVVQSKLGFLEVKNKELEDKLAQAQSEHLKLKEIEVKNKELEDKLAQAQSQQSKAEIKEQKIKSQLAANTNINQNIFEIFDVKKLKESLEFGDGFVNFSAKKNHRLLPYKFCVKNLTQAEQQLGGESSVFLALLGGQRINSIGEATEAYNSQNTVDPLPNRFQPGAAHCGVLVFEIKLTKIESIVSIGLEKEQEIIFKIGIKK